MKAKGGKNRQPDKQQQDMFDKEMAYVDDKYVDSFTEALALVNEGNMTLTDAVDIIVITLHKSRRLSHCVKWKYISVSLIDDLHSPAFINKCQVKYENDKNKTPYLVIACPKHSSDTVKCCDFKDIKINNLVLIFNSLAEQATGYPEYIDAFQKAASQLIAGQLYVMHILVPHRITMCPGNGDNQARSCPASAGMCVPCKQPNVPGQPHTKEVFRVVTCPYKCCDKDDKLIRWCLECGGDHNHDGKCNHKARLDRLPNDTRKNLQAKIDAGEALNCPVCYEYIEKFEGCDKMRCPIGCGSFCLKCSDTIIDGSDYVTEHLLAQNGVFQCRKTIINNAFKGDNESLETVINAYNNGHSRIITDVNAMLKDADQETVPDKLKALVPPNHYQQIESDYLLAHQLVGDDQHEDVHERDHPHQLVGDANGHNIFPPGMFERDQPERDHDERDHPHQLVGDANGHNIFPPGMFERDRDERNHHDQLVGVANDANDVEPEGDDADVDEPEDEVFAFKRYCIDHANDDEPEGDNADFDYRYLTNWIIIIALFLLVITNKMYLSS